MRLQGGVGLTRKETKTEAQFVFVHETVLFGKDKGQLVLELSQLGPVSIELLWEVLCSSNRVTVSVYIARVFLVHRTSSLLLPHLTVQHERLRIGHFLEPRPEGGRPVGTGRGGGRVFEGSQPIGQPSRALEATLSAVGVSNLLFGESVLAIAGSYGDKFVDGKGGKLVRRAHVAWQARYCPASVARSDDGPVWAMVAAWATKFDDMRTHLVSISPLSGAECFTTGASATA